MAKPRVTVGLKPEIVRTLVREVTNRLQTACLPEDWDSIASSLTRASFYAKEISVTLVETEPPSD